MDKVVFQITADGSHTLYVEALDETYHSKHGAIQESIHVFINAGLHYLKQSSLNILEIGFGTGLNAFLTLLEAENHHLTINYTALEKFPLEEKITKQLNYINELKLSLQEIDWFILLHKEEWESSHKITTQFNLKKLQLDLANYKPTKKFDIIYFDAFGPEVQPEMWVTTVFETMFNCLAKKGVLVTYCAKGSVKRTLKKVGFKLEFLPGPPGKREMTRAIK